MRMPNHGKRWIFRWTAAGILAVGFAGTPGAQQGPEKASTPPPSARVWTSQPAAEISPASTEGSYRVLVSTYCVSCHNSKAKIGGLDLDTVNTAEPGAHWEVWE